MSIATRLSLPALIVLLLLAVGCGESSDTSDTRTVTVVTVQQAAEPEPAPEPEPEAETPEAAEEPAPEEPSSGGKIRVPDVVGKDHQLAQDTMQAAGLYMLTEEDASGAGRMLLYDRNWTVVSQSPAPGTMVSEDRTIILRALKDGER
jgi:hypothetical protein